jgi:hypothetical protein
MLDYAKYNFEFSFLNFAPGVMSLQNIFIVKLFMQIIQNKICKLVSNNISL